LSNAQANAYCDEEEEDIKIKLIDYEKIADEDVAATEALIV